MNTLNNLFNLFEGISYEELLKKTIRDERPKDEFAPFRVCSPKNIKKVYIYKIDGEELSNSIFKNSYIHLETYHLLQYGVDQEQFVKDWNKVHNKY